MSSGGARNRSGPPPDPTALRRDRPNDAGWTVLPAAGRPGDPPEWPLTSANAREAHMWRVLWATPQADQWELLGQVIEVALYTRRLVEAEKRGASVSCGTLVRQMADALGLTIPGLRVNRWKIAAGPAAAVADVAEQGTVAGPSARTRFRVVRGDAAG